MITHQDVARCTFLNQYTQRTVPGYASLRGEAATNATVTINERPTFRQGSFFYGGDSADNSTSNLWKELEVYAAINPSGTNTPDIVSAATGTVFIAKTPEQFTYDADGNMTSDGRFHYFWNGENRLVCASNAEVIVTYAYDQRGRMVTKTLWASASSAPLRDENTLRTSRTLREIKSTTYIWDDWNIIREVVREGDSVAVTDNIWGLDLDGTLQGAGGVEGLLAVVRDDGVFLPTYDANGNVSEYVSTNGEIVAHYDYSPFGEPLVASGPLSATFTHQFSTKPYCPVTGFSEYQMRKYNPKIGRWMNRDKIAEFDTLNSFALLDNNALNHPDCFGLFKWAKDNCSIIIEKGDTLSAISAKTGIPIDLLKKRFKNPNIIRPGESINLGGLTYTNTVSFTGYCSCEKCCGKAPGDQGYNICKDGTAACNGTLAADPTIIPFGASVTFTMNGKETTGIVHDIGGKVKNLHIDVWCPSHSEALKINFTAKAVITINCKRNE